MEEINLINSLEIISSQKTNRILKVQGYKKTNNHQEYLEIIIYRGFSSSTTHPIEIDSEKKVMVLNHYFTNFKLFKAPLTKESSDFIREHQDSVFFLNEKNWI